jgi:hypothetical protein
MRPDLYLRRSETRGAVIEKARFDCMCYQFKFGTQGWNSRVGIAIDNSRLEF